MHSKSFGGTLKWPLKGGSRLIEVTATAGLTVRTDDDTPKINRYVLEYDNGLISRKPDFVHSNNKCADQPVHLQSQISTFVTCSLENISIIHVRVE